VTRIQDRKTIVRAETSATYRHRALMVELTPHGVLIREKKRRAGYDVPWVAIYELGMRLDALEKRKTKKHV
jgi:hypothetical protein